MILGIIGTILLVFGILWIFFFGGLAMISALSGAVGAVASGTTRPFGALARPMNQRFAFWATGLLLVALFVLAAISRAGGRRRSRVLPLPPRDRASPAPAAA